MKRYPLIGTLFLVCLMATLLLLLAQNSPETRLEYKQLVEKSEEKKEPKLTQYATEQVRKDVVKEIYFTKNSQRLHMHLESPSSTVTFEKQGKDSELVEHLDSLTATMQEEIDPEAKNQMIRTLQAKQSTYCYFPNHLVMNQVVVARYFLPGLKLPKKIHDLPLMQGTAKSANLSFNKTLSMKAESFKATIHTLDKP